MGKYFHYVSRETLHIHSLLAHVILAQVWLKMLRSKSLPPIFPSCVLMVAPRRKLAVCHDNDRCEVDRSSQAGTHTDSKPEGKGHNDNVVWQPPNEEESDPFRTYSANDSHGSQNDEEASTQGPLCSLLQ